MFYFFSYCFSNDQFSFLMSRITALSLLFCNSICRRREPEMYFMNARILKSSFVLIELLLPTLISILYFRKMLLSASQPSISDDVCDLNDMHIRKYNANMNTRNYLSSKSSPPLLPISYHDLRLVISDQIPSNIVIVPQSLSSFPTLTRTPKPKRRNSEQKKTHKQTNVDVYRSLIRSISRYPIASERNISNNNMTLLSNSFTVDRVCLLPNIGSVHPHNLSKTQRYNSTNSNDKQKSTRTIIPNNKPIPSTPLDTHHRTTSPDQYYEQNNDKMTTTNSLSYIPTNPTRKQLHVYIPQTTCSSMIDFLT